MSGILPDESCENGYKKVNSRTIRGAVFKFNEKRTAITLKEELPKTEDFAADWENFMEHLEPKEAMYCAYDFEFKDHASGYHDGDADTAPIKSKMVLLTWAPDNAKPQIKMLVPSSLKGLQDKCKNCQYTVQMNCIDDAQYINVAAKLGIKL